MSKCDDQFADAVEGILATETGQMAVERIRAALFHHRARRSVQCGGAKVRSAKKNDLPKGEDEAQSPEFQ